MCVRETDRLRGHLFGITTILSSDWLTTSRTAIKGQIVEVNQCKTMTVHDGASWGFHHGSVITGKCRIWLDKTKQLCRS